MGCRLPFTLPTSSLYRPSPNPSARYLIETDPRFTSYRQWLTSDYMLQALALDPATSQKRLGDGFYEQRLINEQVAQLTGRRFLIGYQNEEEQYKALMNAGVTYAREWNLIPGVALSAEQMAQLTSDMVWLVETDVTLADGSTQKVLAPQLYARITGKALDIATLRDFSLQGGSLDADDQLAVRAGRNITIESTTRSAGGRTHIDRIAALYVNNPGGTLQLEANGDIGLMAAYLINNAPTAAGPASRSEGEPAAPGSTTIQAGNKLTLGTVTTAYAESVGDGKHARQESGTREEGTRIETRGDLTLSAGSQLTARAAEVSSSEGRILASAGTDLFIEAGESTLNTAEQHKYKSKGFLSSKKTVTRDSTSDTTAIASTFSGDSVTLVANRDIAVKGSNVVATNDTTLIAGRDLKIEAAAESHNETHFSQTKQSGVFSSGGVGFTIGSKQNSTDQKTDATLAAKSTIGSTDGNITLLAGETYKQVGSDVIAVKGDIDIAAKAVDIVEARETSRTVTETKSKQSGFTVAFTNPVITAVQTAQQMSEAAKETKDGRMKALAAASTGLAGYNAYAALEAGQGTTTTDGKTNQVLSGKTNPDGSAEYRDANAADKMGGVGINLSIGGSKSSSTTTQTSDTAAVSRLTAGRDIRIEASGAGEQSDITLQGTQATAARNLSLAAEDEIRLLAARNTSDQHSSNKNSSASLGIGFMVGGTQNGFTIQAGVSGGKGKADGTDLSHSNTHVEAGQTLTLKSGGDTTLKGAVAKGEQVIADIGKDLKIESLQDTSTYDSQQKSLGASVSLCIPPFCYGAPSTGSVSASNSKVNSDYASVVEQSGIRAGDQGFDVKVKNDTDLKGGAITSTQQAFDDGRNRLSTATLSTSDIANHASASASSSGFNLSSDMLTQGKYGIAKGLIGNALNSAKESENNSSQTRSVVSTGRVEITDEARQLALTGKTVERTVDSLNRDETTAHVASGRIDHYQLEKIVRAEQAIKQETIKIVTTLSDEAYRSRFQEPPKVVKVQCMGETLACINDPSLLIRSPATTDEIANAPPGSIIAVNGIFNDEKRGSELAYQNVPPDKETNEKPNTVYLMHIAPARNDLSELLAVAYEKITASADYGLANFLGYTNGQEVYADLLRSREQKETLSLGHSRGTLVQEGAFTILANRTDENGNAYTNSNLSVRGVAGAANVESFSSKAATVQGPKGDRENITYSYFSTDPVSVVAGGNVGFTTLQDLWQVYKSNNSMHSCGGTGARDCAHVEFPVPGGPQGTPEGNAKLIEYVGGVRKEQPRPGLLQGAQK